VGQLGDRHDAHDGPVVGGAHRGAGLLHPLTGSCWPSQAAQTLCACREQQGSVCGHAPRAPEERLTDAVSRRTGQAYWALRLSLQQGKEAEHHARVRGRLAYCAGGASLDHCAREHLYALSSASECSHLSILGGTYATRIV
jgi:hypothetical protein